MEVKCRFLVNSHLQYHHIVVAEGAELRGPGCVAPNHLVDKILKVQSQLLHTHALTEGNNFSRLDVINHMSSVLHTHTCPSCGPVTSWRFLPLRSVTMNGSWTLSSSYPDDKQGSTNIYTCVHHRLFGLMVGSVSILNILQFMSCTSAKFKFVKVHCILADSFCVCVRGSTMT